MSENGEIYTAGKNFTLLPALTALTNSTSAEPMPYISCISSLSIRISMSLNMSMRSI